MLGQSRRKKRRGETFAKAGNGVPGPEGQLTR